MKFRKSWGDPYRGDCGVYALALAEINKKNNPEIVLFLGEMLNLSENDKEALNEIDFSETDMVHVGVRNKGKIYDASGLVTTEEIGKEYGAKIAFYFNYNKNKSQLGRVIRNNTDFTDAWQDWLYRLKEPSK